MDGSTVYHSSYPYRTGVTRELAAYQCPLRQGYRGRLWPARQSLVVDVGSNDGTLLKAFQAQRREGGGGRADHIALIARQDGVETVQAFFNEETAWQIISGHGYAHVITASNVFAHMAPLGDLVRGIEPCWPG